MAVARCGLPHPAAQRACCLPARPSLQLRGGSSPFPRELAEEVDIFFSAHGVPLSYIEEGEQSGLGGMARSGSVRVHGAAVRVLAPPAHAATNGCLLCITSHLGPHSIPFPPGDPYREEMEECVELVMAELRRRGVRNPHTLAYQSRVGPVEWLRPYTDDSIRCGGGAGQGGDECGRGGGAAGPVQLGGALGIPGEGRCLLTSTTHQECCSVACSVACPCPNVPRPTLLCLHCAGSWHRTACAACWRCPSPLSASILKRWRRLTANTGATLKHVSAAARPAACSCLPLLASRCRPAATLVLGHNQPCCFTAAPGLLPAPH